MSPETTSTSAGAPRAIPCSSRICAVFVCACTLAAIDTLMVRATHDHWRTTQALFAQALAVWAIFAVLAQIPTVLFDRFLLEKLTPDESRMHPARVVLRSMAWTALPVLLHSTIDEYTDLGGNLSGLLSVRPWLEVFGLMCAMFFAIRIAGRVISHVPSLWTLAPLTAAALLAGSFGSFSRESSIVSAGNTTAPRPNILFLVWDTARAQNTTPYGYSKDTTPNLARVADEALLFENARSVAVYTLTSHVSMLTGAYPSQHGARLTRRWFNPSSVPNVARMLREAGYRTGGFVGTDVLRAQSGVGYAFEHYCDRVDPWVTYTHAWALVHDVQSLLARNFLALRSNGLPHWFQDFQRPADEVLADALEWIDDGDPRPWFCFVNLYDAHWPYLPEDVALQRFADPYEGFIDGYSDRGDALRARPDYRMNDQDHSRLVSLYDGELWELDAKVDQFLGRLDLSRTSLLMTSDHGEAFGEGGRLEHMDVLECQVRVPLILRPAGGLVGRRSTFPTSGVDVAPTLLAFAGLAAPQRMHGVNLLGDLPQDRRVLVEHRDNLHDERTKVAVYDGPWKLVREGVVPNLDWRLYDLRSDKEGLVDVAVDHRSMVDVLRKDLDDLRSEWRSADTEGGPAMAGGDVRALRTLGYIDDGLGSR